ncbi:MAG: hypothetical protein ACRDZ7_16075 [Acidimicrobiia bacterium]
MAGPQRFFDPSQPQTLQIATFLLYLDAVLLVITGGFFSTFGMLFAAGSAGGAYGIANSKKWGYGVSVAVAVLALALPLLVGRSLGAMVRYDAVQLMLAVALVALLVHPQSREYQRIWFS